LRRPAASRKPQVIVYVVFAFLRQGLDGALKSPANASSPPPGGIAANKWGMTSGGACDLLSRVRPDWAVESRGQVVGRPSDQSRSRGLSRHASPCGLLKYPTERRVRARGLHDFLGNHGSCRPGALTGRVFQQAAMPASPS
jgi:hypothetical protein